MVYEVYRKTHRLVSEHWLTVAFLLGFIVDNLTLNRVDQVFDNLVLFSYVLLAMLSIVLVYAGIAGRFSERLNQFFRLRSPLLMQYSFGGLLSGMLIFYGRSGSFADSWLFILIILSVMIGNEMIKDRVQRLVYNLVIFFVGLFSYMVLIIPVILGKMGAWIFLLSGVVALGIMYVFMRTLERIVPNFVRLQKRMVVFIIGLIYVGFNVLYFTNIIPPIPLSMKHIGIYHSAVRAEDGSYTLTYEKPKWWRWYRSSDKEFHAETGDSIYCYASVFAPSRLAVPVFHRWEYYDEELGEWRVYGERLSYEIQGGRGDGYRGYTFIRNNSKTGKWRCTVETERGQVIGRGEFEIESGEPGELVTKHDG
jgi:hypothetical protein